MEWSNFFQLIVLLIVGVFLRSFVSYLSLEPFFGKRDCNSMFPKHDWGKWKMVETYKIFHPITSVQIEEGIIQERKCSKCDIVTFKHTSKL